MEALAELFYEDVLCNMFDLPNVVTDIYISGTIGEMPVVEVEYIDEDNVQKNMSFKAECPDHRLKRDSEMQFFHILEEWFEFPEGVQNFVLHLSFMNFPSIQLEYIPTMHRGKKYTGEKWKQNVEDDVEQMLEKIAGLQQLLYLLEE